MCIVGYIFLVVNCLVVYDSLYGNTEKVAQVVASTLKAKAVKVSELNDNAISESDLIVFGSPTQGGKPTKVMEKFIKSHDLKNKQIAAFDTRIDSNTQKIGLKLVMRLIKYASEKMISLSLKQGAVSVMQPEGFIVTDTKGPLKAGELQRAMLWAKSFNSL